MMTFRIQFDPAKGRKNLLKHNVRLADAESVLYDDHALTIEDNDHDEPRWITIGDSGKGQILVVAYTYRDPNFIRLISARKASAREINLYRGK
ncbi:BrnT family toxin [Pseudomonas sp. G.S.17]|uniref:BrnT family toxin n=2 Tax=Pseudomonas sp. G.S.17 TaxID=3137451 RepID=UPI00311C963E